MATEQTPVNDPEMQAALAHALVCVGAARTDVQETIRVPEGVDPSLVFHSLLGIAVALADELDRYEPDRHGVSCSEQVLNELRQAAGVL